MKKILLCGTVAAFALCLGACDNGKNDKKEPNLDKKQKEHVERTTRKW